MVYIWWTLVFIIHVIRYYGVGASCQNISLENTDISSYSESQVATLAIISSVGPQRCAKECRLRTDCGEYLYNKDTLTCVLSTNVNTAAAWNDIQLLAGILIRPIMRRAKATTNLGPCENHACRPGDKCVNLRSGQTRCSGANFTDGSIVLMDGSSHAEGRVEIYHNDEWGTIYANSGWDHDNAKVVCRQLGYGYGVPVINLFTVFGQGAPGMWMDDVSCVGTETVLTDCSHRGWGKYYYSSYAAGVICSQTSFDTANKVPVRLSGGWTPHDGVIQMFYAGHWGSVPFYSFYNLDAKVVCKQLNYTGGVHYTSSAYSGYQKDLVWRGGPSCNGNEQYFSDCYFSYKWGEFPSTGYDDTAVACDDPAGYTINGTVHLVNGDTPYRGRVEILHQSLWGTIYNTNWDNNDAAVVCRELGFSHGLAVSTSAYGTGPPSQPVWLGDVDCDGTEQRLVDCPSAGWGVQPTYTSHYQDAGVVCTENEQDYNASAEGNVRLVDGATELDGRVEVYLHGLWSSICHYTWDYREAQVVCRTLGYTEGAPMYNVVEGSGPVLIEKLQCNGDETHPFDCSIQYYYDSQCKTGVICTGQLTNMTMEGEVQLVGGQNATEGRVEVYHAGHWGMIWETSAWSDANAQVVCTQLGYSGGYPVHGSFFGLGSEPVWMSNVQCTGNEGGLVDCPFDGWGVQTCFTDYNSYKRGIGVVCGQPSAVTYGDIRLQDGPSPSEGRVEIFGPTGFGTMAYIYISSGVGAVVCRQLGFSGYSTYYTGSYFGPGPGTVWIYIMSCSGAEARLEHCSLGGWGITSIGHSYDLGVACNP